MVEPQPKNSAVKERGMAPLVSSSPESNQADTACSVKLPRCKALCRNSGISSSSDEMRVRLRGFTRRGRRAAFHNSRSTEMNRSTPARRSRML